ncbi:MULTISPECIES: DUF3515 domain-containing protein [unclassified Kitasatospora]|uniref:DUF3515 domain-containing protein n=1 Tax=unclassified Kitasatospora TaxID=2633591 RepID=UPI001AE0C2D2|nr:DUF3515 domain-containing protein [Kitasatospora sp. RG8]MBP0449782.1 DUF3515 domain-containing protein [Kitasatospora sp. RG8]
MARELRVPRFLAALPAPVRWLALPLALICTVVVLLGSWSVPAKIEVPEPAPKAAGYCRALAAALPQELLGHARKDPSPASPYVAAWASSPRTVLRCGVDRPEELNGPAASDWSPTVNDVTWWQQKLDDGGYRFTSTMRKAYVEITVPRGAFGNPLDPVSALSDLVKANIP